MQTNDPTEILIQIHEQTHATRKTVATAVTALTDVTEQMQEALAKSQGARLIGFMREDLTKLRNYFESEVCSIKSGQRNLEAAHQRNKLTWKQIAAGIGGGMVLLITVAVMSAAATIAVVTDLPFFKVLFKIFAG